MQLKVDINRKYHDKNDQNRMLRNIFIKKKYRFVLQLQPTINDYIF